MNIFLYKYLLKNIYDNFIMDKPVHKQTKKRIHSKLQSRTKFFCPFSKNNLWCVFTDYLDLLSSLDQSDPQLIQVIQVHVNLELTAIKAYFVLFVCPTWQLYYKVFLLYTNIDVKNIDIKNFQEHNLA